MNIKKLVFDAIIAAGRTARVVFNDVDDLQKSLFAMTALNYTQGTCPGLATDELGIRAGLSFGTDTDIISTFLPWTSVMSVEVLDGDATHLFDPYAVPVSIFETRPSRGDEVTKVTRLSKLRVIEGGKASKETFIEPPKGAA